MNKVSAKIMGGLGNMLFQIACAYAYALRNNKKAIFFTKDSVQIHKNILTYQNNILKNIDLISNQSNNINTVYNEPNFHFNEIPIINEDVCFNGYFQSEKYFLDYKKDIKELFAFSSNQIDDIIKKTIDIYSIDIHQNNLCFIHVRRGDYLNSPNHHPLQNMNYYMKAIKLMPKDSVFLIFSDDIPWCKENFPDIPEKFKFIENNTDIEDLLLMTICNNCIISNSTFSWWGAWLNENKNRIVVAPQKWFGPAYSHYETKDIYCENWIKI